MDSNHYQPSYSPSIALRFIMSNINDIVTRTNNTNTLPTRNHSALLSGCYVPQNDNSKNQRHASTALWKLVAEVLKNVRLSLFAVSKHYLTDWVGGFSACSAVQGSLKLTEMVDLTRVERATF